MALDALSLLPPLLVLVVAFGTRSVVWALVAGVSSAALLITGGNLITSTTLIGTRWFNIMNLSSITSWTSFWDGQSHLLLFLFLTILNMVISLLQQSGDAFAYTALMRRHLSSKKSAEQSSLLLSHILCLDDYLSSITVSSVAPFLTDAFRIPRLKTTFLVTAMAAPLVTLFPLSTWSGAISSFIASGGVTPTGQIAASPFAAYLCSIPFITYSALVVIGAWFITEAGISYGIIAKHEAIAAATGNLYGGGSPARQTNSVDTTQHSLFNFLAPLATLLVTILVAICYLGNHWLLGGSNSLINTFIIASNQINIVLVIGGLASLTVASLLYLHSSTVSILTSWWGGIKDIVPTIIVLSLAWTFADFLNNDLQTGSYIAQLLVAVLSIKLLPTIIFLLASCIALIVGSSWAAMIVVFPIAIPMIPTLLSAQTPIAANATKMLYPVIGAVISGAIFGSSLSPIADLLNIASRRTLVNHFDYLKAQFQYLAPIGLATIATFIAAGFLTDYSYATMALIPLIIGMIIMGSCYLLLNRR